MEIVILLLAASLIIFLLINSIFSKGKTKKIILISNGVIMLFMGVTGIFMGIDNAVIDDYSKKYNVHRGGLLSSVSYEKTEGDYYIFKMTSFLPPSERIAVNKEKVRLPLLTYVYSPVIIFSKENTELSLSEITINSKKYKSAENVEVIRPNYLDMFLVIFAVCIIVLYIFNLFSFIVVLIKIKSK